MRKIHLLIIDPQNSFCDPKGELYVTGAEDDMQRLATMVERCGSKFDDIHVTLDCHHLFDVAHPLFWVGSGGQHPSPFTIISVNDVENGAWTPTVPSLTRRMIAYVKGLEQGGRYPLCIWPPHCLIGTWGNNVIPCLADVLQKWEQDNIAMVDYVSKGSNIYTEHYSGIRAEVADPEDPSTQLNTRLIDTLMEADEIVLTGEASSHCLKSTVEDIAESFGDDSYVKKFVLLTDCCSPVTGFEQQETDFINAMTKRGMRTSTSAEYLS